MALSSEDKTELQAMVLEAVTQITTGVTTHLERYLRDRLIEMQADVDDALDKLTTLDIDLKDVRTSVAYLRRERIKDGRRTEAEEQRIVATTGEIETPKFRIGKLTERLESLEAARKQQP